MKLGFAKYLVLGANRPRSKAAYYLSAAHKCPVGGDVRPITDVFALYQTAKKFHWTCRVRASEGATMSPPQVCSNFGSSGLSAASGPVRGHSSNGKINTGCSDRLGRREFRKFDMAKLVAGSPLWRIQLPDQSDRSRQVIALCGDGGFNMLMCAPAANESRRWRRRRGAREGTRVRHKEVAASAVVAEAHLTGHRDVRAEAAG